MTRKKMNRDNLKDLQNAKSEARKKLEKAVAIDRDANVLYQRMGDRWYAFSLVDDEVFYGSVSEEVVKKKFERDQ